MKWRESPGSYAVTPKPVPAGYEPVGTIRAAGSAFDNFEEAITAFIIRHLPPIEGRKKFVMDDVGAILLGYDYMHNIDTWFWYGTTKAFEIVQAHPAIDSFAAIEWEQCARATGYRYSH